MAYMWEMLKKNGETSIMKNQVLSQNRVSIMIPSDLIGKNNFFDQLS